MNRDRQAAILAISIVIPLTALVLWASEQNHVTGFAEKRQLKVLASFYPLYEFTKIIGGEKIDVSAIVPSGIEPHDWEPTIQDLQKMQNADMIVINGVGLEPWITKLVSVNPDILVVDASNRIPLLEKDKHMFNNKSQNDPHIWLDPVLAKKQIQNIVDGLIIIDPQNSDYYQENAHAYNTKLNLLDNKIRNELSICVKKDFLAFHDAFSYFANEYDLNQNTIIGVNPSDEPTAVTLQQIVQKAQNLDLHIIFTEEAVNPRISEVIADEIGAKVLTLSPIEIYEKNSDYIKRMEQNLSNLKEELCS
ncbi:MAG TPA: zinc ABC transporter substrate-binding protein [Nitrosopumilaceae archaeon]|nr:zinc ABC transporter substrate-binding protein [Nitrosopumilaceae archaeon]